MHFKHSLFNLFYPFKSHFSGIQKTPTFFYLEQQQKGSFPFF